MIFQENLFEGLVKDLSELDWRDVVSKYDDRSLRTFYRENFISDNMVDLMGLLLNAESTADTNLLSYIQEELLFADAKLRQIVGGKERLPRSLLPELRDNIVFNAQVISLEQVESGVQIRYVGSSHLFNLRVLYSVNEPLASSVVATIAPAWWIRRTGPTLPSGPRRRHPPSARTSCRCCRPPSLPRSGRFATSRPPRCSWRSRPLSGRLIPVSGAGGTCSPICQS